MGSEEAAGGGRRKPAADIGVRMAAGIADLAPTDDTVNAQVDVAFTAKSMPPKTYSLVIGADGVGSRVRELCIGPVGGAVKVVFPGWGYWWSTVPAAVCAPFLDSAASPSAGMLEVWEQGQRFGAARLSNGRAMVWGSVQHARPQPPPKDAKKLAHQFCDAFEHLTRHQATEESTSSLASRQHIADILAHLRTGKSAVRFRYPATVKMAAGAPGYLAHKAPLVVIGDAAHATHPALFQGSALALEDGYTLAQAVVCEGGGALLQGQELSAALVRWRRAREEKALLAHQVAPLVSGGLTLPRMQGLLLNRGWRAASARNARRGISRASQWSANWAVIMFLTRCLSFSSSFFSLVPVA